MRNGREQISAQLLIEFVLCVFFFSMMSVHGKCNEKEVEEKNPVRRQSADRFSEKKTDRERDEVH